MKSLVTGALGSGGSYMAEYLAGAREATPIKTSLPPQMIEVHGVGRWHTSRTLRRDPDYPVHECDLTDPMQVLRVLRDVRPDYIYHLASHANVRAGFDNPVAVLDNNIACTLNLLEAVRTLGLDTTFLLCSSSEVYGQVEGGPIDEGYPINPVSPYAVSKMAQDAMGYAWFRSYGVNVVRTRAFTYLNPRRADLFATSFAMQVARIEAGQQHELLHGNLDSVRTVLDVRDAVRAYYLAATYGVPGEVYNIGGTHTITVGEFLETLKDLATCKVRSRQDPDLMRPADVTLQVPDCAKFQALTDWKPEIPFHDSVAFLLNHCRSVVNAA